MFESIVGGKTRPERRLGSGAVLSFLLHAAGLAVILYVPARQKAQSEARGVAVTFFTAPQIAQKGPGPAPAPAPAPLPAPAPPKEATHQKSDVRIPMRKPKTIEEKTVERKIETKVDSKATEPVVAAKTPNPTADATSTNVNSTSKTGEGTEPGTGTTLGEKGGTGRSTQVGSASGTGDTSRKFEVIPFGPGMDRPKRLAFAGVQYTREAILAKVEGTAIAQCVITVSGTLTGCKLIKSLPHLDQAVLKALASSRYSPVIYQGRPVSVRYTITLKVSPPEH